MRLDKTLLGILVGLISATSVNALDPQLDSGGFREEDRPIAEEIAAYSADERHAALVTAGFPEDLLAVQQIQSGSADDFAALIDGFSREDQEQVWDLVRYPGLVADLARGGAKSDADLDRIAQRYPEEIRAAIRSEGRKRYATWVEVYALDLEAEQAFSNVIAKHPEDVRSAFQRLRGRPDLMSLLVDNIGLSTRLGAAYREDPTRVESRFDTLHQEVAAQKSEQEKSWAKELKDPKAQEELRTAARAFAEDQGYALDDGTNNTNNGTIQTNVVHVDHYVNSNPYPYFFGYPSWYATPYWYPASVWTHVGFQFGGGNGFLQVGLPSPYFLGWYNNFYYGAGYGYGGYGGYGGYSYWNYPGSYYGYYGGSNHNHHQFHSAHYYDDHRQRYFNGHRNSPSNGSGAHGSGGSGHALDGNRQSAQGGSMNQSPNGGRGHGPGLDGSGRFGRNNSGGQPGGNGPNGSNVRQFRADPRHTRDGFGGAPGTSPNGSPGGPGSSANPSQHLQRGRGSYPDRQGTSGPGGAPRVERGHRSWQSRGAGGNPGDQGLRNGANPGRQQPPDVSSPPPGRFDRADRRGGRGDQPSRSAWAGFPQSASQHSPQNSFQQQRPLQGGRSTELVRGNAQFGGGSRGLQSFGGAPQSFGRAAHGGGGRAPSIGSFGPGGGGGRGFGGGGPRGGGGSGPSGGGMRGGMGGGFGHAGGGGGGGHGHGGR